MLDNTHFLCHSHELTQGGPAVSFDVVYAGQTCRAFAVRFEGQVYAYLNRCTHVPMEMDWQINQFFDPAGRWLLCATHGAHYDPATGACQGGPCRGGLIKVSVHEQEGAVCWQSQYPIQPLAL